MLNCHQTFGQAAISWGSLPFWQGLQDSFITTKGYPFKLSLGSDGVLVQAEMGNALDDIVANYSDSNYGFITPPPGSSDWGTKLGEGKLRTLESFVGSLNGLKILEIGGGNLFLANIIMHRYSISRYVAIDPALNRWPDVEKVETLRDYFPCTELSDDLFDLVIAHNCLEHIPDTLHFLTSIRGVLKPDGRAFLTFPDTARQFKDGDLNAILHEHLVYLDETSARAIIAKSGMSIVNWSTDSSDLASCLLSVSVAEQVSLHEVSSAALSLLANAIEGFCIRLPNAVHKLHRDIEESRSVAFYGATNGLNNLLFLMGNCCDIPIIDGDSSKRGRFLQTSSMPIQWIGDSELDQFDRIYVTAGSFQPAIIRSLIESHGVKREKIRGLFRPIDGSSE